MEAPSAYNDARVVAAREKLASKFRELRPDHEDTRIMAAMDLAATAHDGQFRRSGEPYVTHPVEVALICLELRLDNDGIIAALLHDVIEDTEVTNAEVRAQFGEDVVQLVEGVTKLEKGVRLDGTANQAARAETLRAAESLRKMLIAMSLDIRVMIIKLADRLHNMRTLDSMPSDRRIRIAQETMDVYAPLAARLGIWQIKWQLEDLSFKVLHPKEFREITEAVAKSRQHREDELKESIRILKERLESKGLHNTQVIGRPKHLYSIFNKVVKQGIPFEQIYDLIALRVIVSQPYECYLALGYVHDLWLPMQGLFSDYISAPKPNGYQSLHTKVIGPHGEPIEVQIRTREMHEIAEYGVAAHFAYKEGERANVRGEAIAELRKQIADWSNDSSNSREFLKAVSTDFFSEQVFVFTPKGDVLDLPAGSTPIDFAFRVHTDLGLITVGAKINGRIVPLSTKLQNGDRVELVTRRDAQPSLDWLEFVQSQHARSKIRAYFRRRNRAENTSRGKEAIEAELKRLGLEPRALTADDSVQKVLVHFKQVDNVADLFARVGEGLASVQSVAMRLRELVRPEVPAEAKDPFRLKGSRATQEARTSMEGVLSRRARCCLPVPGDDVVAYVSRGRGLLIHRRVCPDAMALMDKEPERMTGLDWEPDDNVYDVVLIVVTLNRPGLLGEISSLLGELKTNISAVKAKTGPTAEISLQIDVRDSKHLQHVMNQIGQMSDVISILRAFGRGKFK
jgi:GTP pyrophosphokinase